MNPRIMSQKSLAKLYDHYQATMLELKRSGTSSPALITKRAKEEATMAINPKDATAHHLKASALDLQGFKTLAIESIVKIEKGDELFESRDGDEDEEARVAAKNGNGSGGVKSIKLLGKTRVNRKNL